MADNLTPPFTGAGQTGAPVEAIDTGGGGVGPYRQVIAIKGAGAAFATKAEDAASADADVGIPAMAVQKATPANTAGSDGDYEFLQISVGRLWTSTKVDTALPAGTNVIGQFYGAQVECATDVTRPADTNAYTANDTWADSTSAPTSGGFTLSNAARVSGGAGIITDIIIADSIALPATPLQGELWIFNQSVTAVNDNAAFTISDSEIKTVVAVVPFTIAKNGGANSLVHVQNLNIGFVCSGTANLRFLIKVINAYTPSSAEVLSVRAKIIQTN